MTANRFTRDARRGDKPESPPRKHDDGSMTSLLVAAMGALRRPFAWVANQLDVKGHLSDKRRAVERLRDCAYATVDHAAAVSNTLRAGLPLDHPNLQGTLIEFSSNLGYIQREYLDEVDTRCRTGTKTAAKAVALAAKQLQADLCTLAANAPSRGGSVYVLPKPVQSQYIDALGDAASRLAAANRSFIMAARKDLR
jgi:hypothetical protein